MAVAYRGDTGTAGLRDTDILRRLSGIILLFNQLRNLLYDPRITETPVLRMECNYMKRLSLAVAAAGLLAPWMYHVAQSADAPARAPLAAVAVQASHAAGQVSYEGQVEAVRQTTVAAQVPGAVLSLPVKAGQRVQAGEVLARLDARAADQASIAGRAQQEVAARDLERKRQLYARQYISKAALEQAEAAYKAAAAQATAAQTTSGFHVIRAPYAGVVSAVAVEQGDMAMPGRPLLTLYDPAALRVTAQVPASALRQVSVAQARVDIAGRMVTPIRVEILPTVDPRSMTQQVRATLPGGLAVAPGQFARLWLPQGTASEGMALSDDNLQVPLKAIVRRAEMTGLYVLDQNSRPLLRQVRLGRAHGDTVEILSGLQAGERVVTDPQAAARAQ